MSKFLVILYLVAIVAANLLVVQFGPSITILNAFLFIGLDITARDSLHESWKGKHLWLKMLFLIATGSLLSYVLNSGAQQIAIASFVAFLFSGLSDTLIYWILGDKSYLVKVNGSNLVSSMVDSVLFPLLAFGWPLLWWIVLGQFVAKVLGGFIWSIVLRKTLG